ncbi:MAG: amidohydrolase family protein [Halobacteriales archaeon]|nr:amidohydrolase family protein [Halobacteriales archaeon]
MRCVRTAGVYHPDGGTVEGSVVCFEAGKITAIEDTVPSDAEVLADTDGYALPGLVDAHSHASIRPWEGDQLAQLRADKARGAARAISNLRTDLEAGTTTMRLMAEERHLDIELADLEAEGEITAPRLLPSGVHLTPTGGHGQAITATDGPDAIREQIRTNLAAGAHHVKYFATGGISSATGGLASAPYADAEVEAIVEEAHRQGVHVGAHAHGGPGARQAIDAGVDTIEHAGALGEAAIDRLDGGDQHVVGTFSILNHPRGIEAGDADEPAIMAKVETART